MVNAVKKKHTATTDMNSNPLSNAACRRLRLSCERRSCSSCSFVDIGVQSVFTGKQLTERLLDSSQA